MTRGKGTAKYRDGQGTRRRSLLPLVHDAQLARSPGHARILTSHPDAKTSEPIVSRCALISPGQRSSLLPPSPRRHAICQRVATGAHAGIHHPSPLQPGTAYGETGRQAPPIHGGEMDEWIDGLAGDPLNYMGYLFLASSSPYARTRA